MPLKQQKTTINLSVNFFLGMSPVEKKLPEVSWQTRRKFAKTAEIWRQLKEVFE